MWAVRLTKEAARVEAERAAGHHTRDRSRCSSSAANPRTGREMMMVREQPADASPAGKRSPSPEDVEKQAVERQAREASEMRGEARREARRGEATRARERAAVTLLIKNEYLTTGAWWEKAE